MHIALKNWKYILLGFVLLLGSIIALDAYIFLNFAANIDTLTLDPIVSVERLDEARFAEILEYITNKEKVFQKTAAEGVTAPQLFDTMAP